MPSQRADNKRCIATWVDKSVKQRLEKLAKEQGRPLSELVLELYEQHLRKDSRAHKKIKT